MKVKKERKFFDGLFNDIRLAKRANKILEMLCNKGKSIVNRFCTIESDEKGTLRFMNNDNVSISALKEASYRDCKKRVKGKQILAIQDTTVIDYSSKSGRLKLYNGEIGPTDQKGSIGYFLHPTLVVDAEKRFPIGFSSIIEWNRSFSVGDKHERNYKQLNIEDKESYRWLESVNKSSEVLSEASEITFISDRESDIYEEFVEILSTNNHLLIRSSHNRKLYDSSEKLFSYLSSLKVSGEMKLLIKNTRNRKSRNAILEIRYSKVKLPCPENKLKYGLPPYVELTGIEIKEKESSLPKGEKPILWRLLTTHEVDSAESAMKMAEWYSMRWWIEELFRVLKKQGLDIESSCFENGKSLKKLGIISLHAALKIMQLKAGRDGKSDISPKLLFTEEELKFQKKLLMTLGISTKKQQNPYDENNIAWSSWIIARLGGWKTSQSSPPGHITMKRGLEIFYQQFAGWMLAFDN
jgi:hypothetical protein